MFITYRHTEVRLDLPFEYSPAQLWTAVEQDFQSPWFYVQIARQDGDEVIISTLLLQHIHDLESIVKSQSKRAWIEHVQIVTPAHLNGQERWQMEPLQEVHLVKDKKGNRGLLFKVENNICYSLHPQRNIEDLVLIKVLFSAKSDLKWP